MASAAAAGTMGCRTAFPEPWGNGQKLDATNLSPAGSVTGQQTRKIILLAVLGRHTWASVSAIQIRKHLKYQSELGTAWFALL